MLLQVYYCAGNAQYCRKMLGVFDCLVLQIFIHFRRVEMLLFGAFIVRGIVCNILCSIFVL